MDYINHPKGPPGNLFRSRTGIQGDFSSSHSSSSSSFVYEHQGIGAEPGIDPHRKRHFEQYGQFSQDCIIDVVDYSTIGMKVKRFKTNEEFVKFVEIDKMTAVNPELGSESGGKPVRWINCGGISWDVISALAIHYELEPLAIEDVLGEQGHNQSKVDYSPRHLFIRILSHSLNRSEDGKNASQEGDLLEDRTLKVEKRGDIEAPPESRMQKLWMLTTGLSGYHSEKRRQQTLSIHAIKKGDKVNITLEPFFVFLMNDDIVITIHPSPSLTFTDRIMRRLEESDSLLRSHEDASILVQSLLDLSNSSSPTFVHFWLEPCISCPGTSFSTNAHWSQSKL